MSDDEAAVERTQPSFLKTALLGIVCIPVCVVLALLEIYALGAAGLHLDELQYVALLSVLNFIPMAVIFHRFGGFERRWFAAGGTLSLAIIVGGYFLLQGLLLPRILGLPGSLQLPESGPVVVEILPSRPISPPSPPPPQLSPTTSSPLPPAPALPSPSPIQAQQPLPQAQTPPAAAPISPPAASAPPVIVATRPFDRVQPRIEAEREARTAEARIGGETLAPAERPASEAPISLGIPETTAFPRVQFPTLGPGLSLPPPLPPAPTQSANASAAAPSAPPAVAKDGGGARTESEKLDRIPAWAKTAKATAAAPSAPLAGRPRADLPGAVRAERSDGGSVAVGSPAAGGSPGGGGPPAGGTPPPAPALGEASAPPPPPDNTSAYWNTWFVDGTGPASNVLIANNTYTYSLDLSAFNYAALRKTSQSSGTKVGDALRDIINDPRVPEALLNIKPIVPEGSGLRLIDAKASYLLKVDLEKIRHPNAAAAKQYAGGSMLIAELSRQVSAGSIQFAVTAESQGCATIAFAIFSGLLPLDHLVQRVSIGDNSKSAPVCDSEDPAQRNALSGGLDSLREVTLGMEGSGASVTAAAALHIFDFDAYSMAVFVDGRPGQSQPVYGWQTASSVVDFLKTDNFQNVILKARKDSADKKPGSYVRAAQELSKVLFTTKPGNTTETEAKNAQAAFKSVVQESKGSPAIVVRVASSMLAGQNHSIYVPLGILGAKGPGAVLDKPIIVVQPMALERYPSRDKCIGEWMFAVPDGLENVSATIMPPGFFPAKIPGTRISDIEHLREYLAEVGGTATPLMAASASAVGLVVLAHQDEGFLWFAESTDSIMPQDIGRKFPAGSVGIFAACSAASAKGRNAALLQRLNEQGIDTLIASPFTIDAGYGVVFASSFAEVVQETTADKKQPTILELFDKTISKTAQKFKDKTQGEYGELGLEYVLLGNPAITLCAPPP
jgi:hypothetical protein